MNKDRKQKILFVKHKNSNAKFVSNDIEILNEQYEVILNNVNTRKNISIIFALLKQFLFLLFTIYRYKAVYIWFADYHSFLPVFFSELYRKKSIICAGGYEATFVPEVNCGVFTNDSFSKKVRRLFVEFSLKNCSLILPVDDSLIENTNTFIYSDSPDKAPLKDGIKYFLPKIKTKIISLPPGYDENIFRKMRDISKKKIIMGAGFIPNRDEIKRKGFDLLIEAAKMMNDAIFVLVGFNKELMDEINEMKIGNLKLYGKVSYEKLIELYSSAKVFSQISLFEGLPSTICEAMLCECIPVGSNVNGIPKIINDTGFIVYKKDLNEIVRSLRSALESPDELGLKARENIIQNFSYKKRQKELSNILSSILNN